MNNTNRKLLFALICIPIRLLISYIPQTTLLSDTMFKFMGIALLLISSSLMFLYFTNGRMNAFEGGGKTWWAKLRIFHSIFYLLAGLLILYSNKYIKYASIPLLMDVLLGIGGFVVFR
uniref:Uncharacterized protein n=1 Tax=viral metagenome TaxID=1070528 RepID=A0A6C0J4W8_9ZZZZ